MATTLSYVDIGGLQRKEGGGSSAQTSYVDIGAIQRQEVATGNSNFFVFFNGILPFIVTSVSVVTAHFLGGR